MKTAIYLFKIRKPNGEFITFPTPVKLIGESKKSFHVELLERGPVGQHIGTKYWPRKRNVVKIMENEMTADIAIIRLPYKD
jgi:hypothetical protein